MTSERKMKGVVVLLLGAASLTVASSLAPGQADQGTAVSPAHPHFGSLGSWGHAWGKGSAEVTDDVLHIEATFPKMPCDMETLLDLPNTDGLPLDARLVFKFPYRGYLRAGAVLINTDLPALPAVSNVDDVFRQRYAPRSRLSLEYELLASTYEPGAKQRLSMVFMVRVRLVQMYDDADLGYSAPSGEEGHSWPQGTPVYAPSGADSEEVGRVEARPARRLPWAYVLIKAPRHAEAWFRSGVVKEGRLKRARTLCLVHGYFEKV